MDLRELLETPPWDWPSDTPQRLLGVLKDSGASPADRLIAAELAGDLTVINDDLAIVLVSIAESPVDPPDLRAQSALALGAVLEQCDIDEDDDPEFSPITRRTFRKLQERLKKIFLDPKEPVEVRRRVMEASVRAPQTWHAKAIRTAYECGERDWVLTAVFCMQWVQGFDNEILSALRNPDAEIQKEAVEAAGNWSLRAAWRTVASILRDKSSPKRLLLAAIRVSPEIRREEAAALLQRHANSGDAEIAEAAEEALLATQFDAGIDDFEDEEEPPRGPWIN